MTIFPLLLIAAAILLLIALSAIDLKYWILPDELNFALGAAGIVFHILTAYEFVSPLHMFLGAAAGAAMLYVIRFVANRHYGRDTLGLGDVKLLAAAGLWLGLDHTLQAITIGAAAGLVHGLAYAGWLTVRYGKPYSVAQLSIPAGPGFAVGIAVSGWFMLGGFILEQLR